LYVGTCTQTFVKIVRQDLKEKGEEDVKNNPVVEKKLEGLKLAWNINTLIKELFNIPPRFKATINLSWLEGATKTKLVSNISLNYQSAKINHFYYRPKLFRRVKSMNLLRLMENLNGLMAAIIANKYISLQKINLVPNSLTIQLVTILLA